MVKCDHVWQNCLHVDLCNFLKLKCYKSRTLTWLTMRSQERPCVTRWLCTLYCQYTTTSMTINVLIYLIMQIQQFINNWSLLICHHSPLHRIPLCMTLICNKQLLGYILILKMQAHKSDYFPFARFFLFVPYNNGTSKSDVHFVVRTVNAN